MCGIVGIWNYRTGEPIRRDLLEAMAACLEHRGPDDSGRYFDDEHGFGFGFRRLAIVDLSPAGHQPMATADESLWIVFNGEIYNFPELRQAQEQRGHQFRSCSDTEVILHQYEDRGVDCAVDLNGMFGLALWDRSRQRLMLARDRVGKKPLYYYDDGHRLVFASELKAIIHDRSIPRQLDQQAFAEYLALGYVSGGRSILQGFRKLAPAQTLVLEDGRSAVQRYWDWLPSFTRPNRERSIDEWSGLIRASLRDAVRRRMISDVPLGAFLSGGVDSSAVVGMMAEISSEPLKTFSIGFADPRYDERAYARQVAEHFGTDHRELVVEPEAARDVLPRLAQQYDEPFADSSALPTYYVCKLAREHVTVALSGDGGDEACAGYDRYSQALSEGRFERLPHAVRRAVTASAALLPSHLPGRRLARRVSMSDDERYVTYMRFVPPDQRDMLLTPAARLQAGPDGVTSIVDALNQARALDLLSRAQYADGRTYLPDDILVKVDRASMLNSLEVRCPILDYEILELMATVPPELRLHGGQGKWLLKRALRGFLPDSVLDRPKMGFGAPLEGWFRDDLQPFLREILLDDQTTRAGIFQRAALERLVLPGRQSRQEHLQHVQHVWLVLMFELWRRHYLDA